MNPTLAARALLLLAMSACSGAPAVELSRKQEAIYGGTTVAPGEWAAVVALPACTGVLLADRLVVYAAHCGTDVYEIVIGSDVSTSERHVLVSACRAHPQAALGNGRDVAFCWLEEAIEDVVPLRLLTETEAAMVEPGIEVQQLGYGKDHDGGEFGSKRQTVGLIEAVGDDIIIVGESGGTCEGDSGGPALVQAGAKAGGSADWRVLGVLSAGTSLDCEITRDHYTNLTSVRGWLEDESGISLSATPVASRPVSRGCTTGRGSDSGRPLVELLIIATLLGARLAAKRRNSPSAAPCAFSSARRMSAK